MLRHIGLQHLAYVVHSTPEVVLHAVDLHEHLNQVPTPAGGAQACDPLFADLSCKYRPEPLHPEPNRLMAHLDAALMQKVLDVPEGEREPHIHITVSRMISGLVRM